MIIKNGVLLKVDENDINRDGSFTFPKGVTSIRSHAFCDCISLKEIRITEGVTSIRERCFQRLYRIKRDKDTKRSNKYKRVCFL